MRDLLNQLSPPIIPMRDFNVQYCITSETKKLDSIHTSRIIARRSIGPKHGPKMERTETEISVQSEEQLLIYRVSKYPG